MYQFSYFKERDKARILEFLEAYPFAFLTGSFKNGEQVATQIPVITEERHGELYVRGHIMRQTDHEKAFRENANGLLVFTGPNAYVSATWYSNPLSGSTWNYMSVHVKGQLRFLSADELKTLMRDLTLKFEGGNRYSKTIYDNLPGDYLNKMMPAIAGFEIKADMLDNVFKLSQNKDEESYLRIIRELEERGGNSALVAEEMKKRKAELFRPNGSGITPNTISE